MAKSPLAVRSLFDRAVEIETLPDRQAYLAEACAGDRQLLEEVTSLLAAHDAAGDFLSGPLTFEQIAGAPESEQPLDSTVSLVTTASDQASVSNHEPSIPDFLQPSSKPGSLGRLGHYEVVQVIGKGGMGTVLKAFDEKLQRVVAIKVLASELAANAIARKRFVREAQTAAAVSSEHLVTIHAVEEEHRPPYLVMQFVDGRSLQEKIQEDGALEAAEIVHIGAQMAAGLAAAHKRGLIHRDIKPSNILLQGDKRERSAAVVAPDESFSSASELRTIVKITDFGLARAADDSQLTQTGVVAGTPMFMSPEQAEGHSVDHRSDLFSLGSVLYAMCTGQAPFRAGSTIGVMRRVCDDTPLPIAEINARIPTWLVELIAKLHAKDPAERFQSAGEVAEILGKRLTELQTADGRPSGEAKPPMDAKTVAAPDWSAIDSPQPERGLEAEARAPRRRWWTIAAFVFLAVCGGLALTEATGITNLTGTVVRFSTPEGVLVVEIDDPAVSVAFDDGEVIVSGAGAKEIRLKPGTYKLKASKDGKVFKQELIDIQKAGRQVIKIVFVPWGAEAKVKDPPAPTSAPPDVVPADWYRAVAAMPAEKQVEAVAAKLKELNPGFDGKVESTISKDGVVVALRVKTEEVTNIDPLRALLGLRQLNLEAVAGGKLSDLTPLRGLALSKLAITSNQVTDLSPLEGMPVMDLKCGNNPIKSLEALRGMPLQSLICWNTLITDLKPLASTSLQRLECGATPLTDLGPLAGLRLKYLTISQSNVADLSPLKGMPLGWLHFAKTPVHDLSVLKQLPLISITVDLSPWADVEGLKSIKTLQFVNDKPAADFWKELHDQRAGIDDFAIAVAKMNPDEQVKAVIAKLQEMNKGFDGKHTATLSKDKSKVAELHFQTDAVTNIAPVRALPNLQDLACAGSAAGKGKLVDLWPLSGLKINVVRCGNNSLFDLTPLKTLPLQHLLCGGTEVASLTPLAGLKLERVECHDTKVSDLTPLKGQPVKTLSVGGTLVTSLEAIRGMPLTSLNIRGLKVSDLTPAQGMKLTQLLCPNTGVKDLSVVHGMPLNLLSITQTQVSDLTPLMGIPLAILQGDNAKVTDLGPIRRLPLKELRCDFNSWRDTEHVQAIKTLERINNKPAAEFWKEQETQRAAFDKWAGDVAKLKPAEQAKEVVEELKRRNPGFDGKLPQFTATDKGVTELGFYCDVVTDVAPVRALAGLETLHCTGTAPGRGKLSDISPLMGLPLRGLYLDCTQVRDLTPLAKMPLVRLSISNTKVGDLRVLAGMPLGQFWCGSTEVSDLSPLRDCPLIALRCDFTGVADLSPLRDKALGVLSFRSTRVHDLSLLAKLPLKDVYFDFNPWRDAELLRSLKDLEKINEKPATEFWKEHEANRAAFEQWCAKVAKLTPEEQLEAVALRLKKLNPKFDGKLTAQKTEGDAVTAFGFVTDHITDISPVRALPGLKTLVIRGSATDVGSAAVKGHGTLSDLWPLRGMALTTLDFAYNPVPDLKPLEGMPLTHVSCLLNPVSDVAALKDAPLQDLNIAFTTVADLAPLNVKSLHTLYMDRTKVTDLSPLRAAPLTKLVMPSTRVTSLAPLKGHALTWLSIQSTPISDLSPLAGMPLTVLSCSGTKVVDLSPLSGIRLIRMDYRLTKVTDITPLAGAPLEEVLCTFEAARDEAVLRAIKTLKKINDKPAAEFWKEHDAKGAALDQCSADVARMAPEHLSAPRLLFPPRRHTLCLSIG